LLEHGEDLCVTRPDGAGKITTLEIPEGFRVRDGGQVPSRSICLWRWVLCAGRMWEISQLADVSRDQ
jgi:hypothetical protein